MRSLKYLPLVFLILWRIAIPLALRFKLGGTGSIERFSKKASSMFATFDEQMRIDEQKVTAKRKRMIRLTIIAFLSVTLFSAL